MIPFRYIYGLALSFFAPITLAMVRMPVPARSQCVVPPLFKKIEVWHEVMPFAGHIVAYKTNLPCFGHHKGYQLTDDQELKFGYIHTDPWHREVYHPHIHIIDPLPEEVGYNMMQLLSKDEVEEQCALIRSNLAREDSVLLIRHITLGELRLLYEAVKTAQAKFAYIDLYNKEKIYALLKEAA